MTENTFLYTISQSVDDWLIDVKHLRKLVHENSRKEIQTTKLDEQIQLVSILQQSSVLVKETNQGRPLYHYELQGPVLTKLLLANSEFVAELKWRTRHLNKESNNDI